MRRLAFFLGLLGLSGMGGADAQKAWEAKQVSVKAGGKTFTVQLVKADLKRVRVKVGLANGAVGKTEALEKIAARYKAVAAINGGFFEAYEKGAYKNPNHMLITNGRVIHLGNVGTVAGFTLGGSVLMDSLTLAIEGSQNNSFAPGNRWYAYWLNRHTTSNTATIFTPEWGIRTGMPGGTQVVAENGVITRIGTGSQVIPSNGFVVYLNGVSDQAFQRFKVGAPIGYRVVKRGQASLGEWEQVTEGLGAGPRLMTEGRMTVDPKSEGFSSAKILSGSFARSALGVTKKGELLLATTSGTVGQLAQVMKALGAWNAMNLDGGASSGLWTKGKYWRKPGRALSHALLLIEK